VDDSDAFDFAIDEGQGFGDDSVVLAQLQDGTRVFTRRGIEVDDSEIVPDTEAKIDGVLSSNTSDGTKLKTSLVVLDLSRDLEVLSGRIIDIDSTDRELFIDVVDEGATIERCVEVPEETDIFLLYTKYNAEDNTAVKEDGTFEDLMVGWKVRIFGESGENGCLVSKTILAFPEPAEDVLCEGPDQCEIGEFCEKPGGMCESVGVCTGTPDACALFFDPVCGCDGQTYSNECDANQGRTSVAHEGECAMSQPI
jgi:hypothetical protein